MKLVPIVLINGKTVNLPMEVEIANFRNHLGGARAWFFDKGEESEAPYLIKQYNVKIGDHDILNKKYLLKKISCPKNSILLGVLFDKEYNPNFFLLEPKSEDAEQTLCIALVDEAEEIPDGYTYHSTSLKPNFATKHCIYKIE